MRSDVENGDGINAPISDTPPSGIYAQARSALSGKSKALLALFVLALLGVVAAIAATTMSGSTLSSNESVPVNNLEAGSEPTDSPTSDGGDGDIVITPGGVATKAPSLAPTGWDYYSYSSEDTASPNAQPTPNPNGSTPSPTSPTVPTPGPTQAPTGPTKSPTMAPTNFPTVSPTRAPTKAPTPPTPAPTMAPTPKPTRWARG